MNYKPLPASLTIKKSNIQGLGLFATTDIREGVLGIGWVKQDHFPDGFLRTPMGGFINHSETPICEKLMHEEVGVMWLKAIRDIKEGEELTVEYTLYQL